MIDITESRTPCCLMLLGRCTALIRTECDKCKFYKPFGCDDWVRIDKEGRAYLIPPEDYEKIRREINK